MDYDQGVVHRRRIISPPDSFFVNTGGSSGGGGGGGIAALNPLDKTTHTALTNSNLTITSSGGPAAARSTTSHSSGKYYFKVLIDAGGNSYSHAIGVVTGTKNLDDMATLTGNAALYYGDTHLYGYGSSADTGNSYVIGDTSEFCIDIDNGKWWSRNLHGTTADWNNTVGANPTSNSGGIDISILPTPWFVLGYCNDTGAGEGSHTYNFTDLSDAPSGFVGW